MTYYLDTRRESGEEKGEMNDVIEGIYGSHSLCTTRDHRVGFIMSWERSVAMMRADGWWCATAHCPQGRISLLPAQSDAAALYR
jgi:hypothetical protein